MRAKPSLVFTSTYWLGVALFVISPVLAQGPDCQAGTGPVAGFASETELATAAAATPNVCAFNPTVNAAAKTKIKHVLLMDWTNGGHNRTHTQKHMYRLARKYGFRLTRSQSNTYITETTLQGVDIVVFNNGEQDPLGGTISLSAMRNFIETQGKGMLAIHSALSFIPCADENVTVASLTTCRWFFRAYGTQFSYGYLLHNSSNRVRIYADSVLQGGIPPNARAADSVPATMPHGRKNPSTRMIFEDLPLNGPSGPLANRSYIWEGLWDEWFNYRHNARRVPSGVYAGIYWGPVNILLSIDESLDSYPNTHTCSQASPCKVGDRSVSWTRQVDKGLAAYNNAGHGDVYVRPRVVNGVTVNDSLMEKYNWRLMKYLARDFVGCMDPESPHYNPEASVEVLTPGFDDPNPCKAVVSVFSVDTPRILGPVIDVLAHSRSIRVEISTSGEYDVRVTDLQGRGVASTTVSGGNRFVELAVPGVGLWVVRVSVPDGSVATRIVMVD